MRRVHDRMIANSLTVRSHQGIIVGMKTLLLAILLSFSAISCTSNSQPDSSMDASFTE